jgi:phage N-6-adenine-methyltransferase
MSLVGFRANNHPQQVGKRGASTATDDRGTPWAVFNPLHERFRFTLDACATTENAKLPRYFTKEQDGLAQSWAGERVWCNPPYSALAAWLRKTWLEVASANRAELVVMLVPANRTEQAWWQNYVEPVRDQPDTILRTEFWRGRTRFILPGKDGIEPNQRPPFGCALLIWQHAAERLVT